MIRYSLACHDGHHFESWFSDSTSYERQSDRGMVACPTCLSTRTHKTIMAPAVVSTRRTIVESTSPATAPESPAMTLVDERSRAIRAMLRAMHDKLTTDGHDVGANFAVEARRIHDGAAPERQIYGQASMDEARDLIEEGIMVMPFPVVPDELN